jgi:hypothetical protein
VQLLGVRATECFAETGFEFFCRFQAVSRAYNGMLGVATAFCLGVAVLGVLWVYTIPENPPCPECGHRSRTDYGVCRWCGHIFLRPSPAHTD